ncbi:MAG: hypothetical protein F6K17_43195, partial [Okeania sp. SIO3C4]|nr:hypothetical protein [Okeania sp. SIO3C4]
DQYDSNRNRSDRERAAVRLEMSMRLPPNFNVRTKPENNGDIRRLTEKIQRIFRREKYRKGVNKFTYREPEKGYRFSLNMRDETEARRLISDVLDLQDHRPNWDLLNDHSANQYRPDGDLKMNPPRQLLGDLRKKPLSRRRGEIELYYVLLKVHGCNDLCLIKRRSSRKKSLALFD